MSWELEFDSQWKKFLDIVGTLIHREIDNNRRLDSEFVNSIIHKEVEKWSISTHYNGAWLRNFTIKYPSLAEEFRTALKELRLSDGISFHLDVPISRLAKLVAIAWAIFLILFLVWSGYPFLIKSNFLAPQQVKPTPQAPQQVKPTPQAPQQVKPTPQLPQQVKPTPQAPQQAKASAWEMVRLPFVRLLLGTAFVAFITFPIFLHLRTQQKKKALDNLVEQIKKDLETTGQKLRSIVSKADKANYPTE